MKKLLLCVIMIAFGVTVNSQRVSFGVTGGYHNLVTKLYIDSEGADVAVSSDASGYFVGFVADISISDDFNIQPEINFSKAFREGDDQNVLIMPIMVKYYISDEFSVQSGPVFDFILDSEADNINKFGLGIGLGAGYDFSNKLFASARYSFGLTDRLKEISGISSKLNTFQLGLGYRF